MLEWIWGPFVVKERKRRIAKSFKTYHTALICLSTKAIDLEADMEAFPWKLYLQLQIV